jgi:hypothetical protein
MLKPKTNSKKSGSKKGSTAESPGAFAAAAADISGFVSGKSKKAAAAANKVLAGVTIEEKHRLIAEAAYFRSERRNFIPGHELEDWLDAEAEIETRLLNINRAPKPAKTR